MNLTDFVGGQSNSFPEAPLDGSTYGRKDADWVVVFNYNEATQYFAPMAHSHAAFSGAGSTGFVPDPGASQGYLKANGTWEVPTTTGVPEAPVDGNQYARQNAAWSVVQSGSGGITEAPVDGNTYGRKNAGWTVLTTTIQDWLRADVADIKTAGTLTFNDNVELAFGTGNDARFYCNGTHAYLRLDSGIGNFYILDGTTTRFTFDDNGTFTATGDIGTSSDARLKTNVWKIYGALDKVRQLNGVTFDRIGVLGRKTGLIAQDVQAAMPEAVMVSEEGYLSVAYGNLVGLLVEAIKELEQRVEVLEHAAAE